MLPFGAESAYDVVWSGTVIIEEAALTELPTVAEEASRARRRPVRGSEQD